MGVRARVDTSRSTSSTIITTHPSTVTSTDKTRALPHHESSAKTHRMSTTSSARSVPGAGESPAGTKPTSRLCGSTAHCSCRQVKREDSALAVTALAHLIRLHPAALKTGPTSRIGANELSEFLLLRPRIEPARELILHVRLARTLFDRIELCDGSRRAAGAAVRTDRAFYAGTPLFISGSGRCKACGLVRRSLSPGRWMNGW